MVQPGSGLWLQLVQFYVQVRLHNARVGGAGSELHVKAACSDIRQWHVAAAGAGGWARLI